MHSLIAVQLHSPCAKVLAPMECTTLSTASTSHLPSRLYSTDRICRRSPATVRCVAAARNHVASSSSLPCRSSGPRLGSLRGNQPLSIPALGNEPLSHARHSVQVNAVKKTYSSFDDMLANSDVPVLVDFYATWCGPCQYMVPILNEVGRVLKDELRIVKIDTEKYPNVAGRYGVQALPTLIIFRDGQPIDRLEGALPADKLIRHVKDVLYGSRAKARN